MKSIKCKNCEFTFTLITRVKPDEVAVQVGWEDLKEHWRLEHPAAYQELQEWIGVEDTWKEPHDSEEMCLG